MEKFTHTSCVPETITPLALHRMSPEFIRLTDSQLELLRLGLCEPVDFPERSLRDIKRSFAFSKTWFPMTTYAMVIETRDYELPLFLNLQVSKPEILSVFT